MIGFLSSLFHLMSGMGVPSALHTREALLFSRTLTVEGELSRSLKLGGTGRLRGIDGT